MEYYYYAIMDVWHKYHFELFWLSVGLLGMAFMDFIIFQRPKDSGYWSLHTKGSRRDAWHDTKRVAILAFAVAAIGDVHLLYLVNNPFIQVALLAIILQKVYHILKWIYQKFNKQRS